jgi:hypothetical protein
MPIPARRGVALFLLRATDARGLALLRLALPDHVATLSTAAANDGKAADRMTQACPTCGQPLVTRYGVRLQAKQADIFDLIEHAKGRGGIALACLADAIYPGVDTTRARQRIKVQVGKINDRLVSTDRRVVRRDGRYCFEAAP